MKKILQIIALLFIFFSTLSSGSLHSQANTGQLVIIYDNSSTISSIQSQLTIYETQGWQISKMDRSSSSYSELLEDVYRVNYFLDTNASYPVLLFAGSTVYTSLTDIQDRLVNNTLFSGAIQPLTTLKQVVYFYSPTCTFCQSVAAEIDSIPSLGVHLTKYDITAGQNLALLDDYRASYFLTQSDLVPLLFVGQNVYKTVDAIETIINDQSIVTLATTPMRDIIDADGFQIEGWLGVVYIVFSGFLDGFNPCAIAMLLLFVSLLGFGENRKALIGISLTFIGALFLSYFALGTFLFQFLQYLNLASFMNVVSWVMMIFGFFLFILNFWDFLAARQEKYGDIKNQLPKFIKKFNKQIIGFFSNQINKGGKLMYIFTFALGVIISLTEFLCTGQIYLPVIVALIQFSDTLNFVAILYLVLYNLAFVGPLIIIAVLTIRTQSVMGTSNKVRENLHWIKLLNAILFLVIGLYYLWRII